MSSLIVVIIDKNKSVIVVAHAPALIVNALQIKETIFDTFAHFDTVTEFSDLASLVVLIHGDGFAA